MQSFYFLNFPNFKPLAILFGCTARVVLDLVRNPEDGFSNDAVHIISDSIDPDKVSQLVDSLYHSEEEVEETLVKVPKTFEERKQLGMIHYTESL